MITVSVMTQKINHSEIFMYIAGIYFMYILINNIIIFIYLNLEYTS